MTSSNPSILVVEDDDIFQMIYQASLGERCQRLVCVKSLTEAREHIVTGAAAFDLVILDNQLGDGEGIALVGQIKCAFPYCAVLMVSGNADADFLLRAFDSGIDDYMIKPVNYDLLWQKIGSMVQRFALQRLADEQQLALRHWKDAAEREQALASYLYDGFLRYTSESSSFLQVWIQSSDSFSGDCILQFAGLDGSQYIMVADAMGHGLAAAVSLMPLIRIFADKARKATPLTQMLYAMNDAGNSLLPDDRFVAAALIRLSPASREAEVWNGGLPPILVTDKQGNIFTRCHSMHMPLGILDKFQFDAKPQTVSIDENTLLIAFTDGMIETPDDAGQCLTDTRIAALVAQDVMQLSAIKHMVTTQLRHPDDDISVGVVDCGALLSHGSRDGLLGNNLEQASQLTCHYRLCGHALANTDVPGQVARMLRMQSLSTHLIQTVFTVLTELYVNAIEHGVLDLDSRLKDEPDGFLQFYTEKETRLQQLTEQHFVDIEIAWDASKRVLRLTISDSGRGVDWTTSEEDGQSKSHGRGLSLVRQLTSSFTIVPPGNQFIAVFSGVS